MTGVPSGMLRGTEIVNGTIASVLAVVNVVSNDIVSPPVTFTLIDLMPRLSVTSTWNARSESSVVPPFASWIVGGDLSLRYPPGPVFESLQQEVSSAIAAIAPREATRRERKDMKSQVRLRLDFLYIHLSEYTNLVQ